jgi:SAM-dependent methyltransferase
MHPDDRSRLAFMMRYALRHPERIVPHGRRLARDAALRLRHRDHVSYYRAVMRSNAARGGEGAVGSHTRESWLRVGQMQFDYLVSHGLKPGMRMLEIGCGNLRAGRLFIEHLDPGDYYGIDISPEILLAAQRTLAGAGLQHKLPHLTLVLDLKLEFLPAGYFDVVHAHSVFSHSPIEVIDECLAHVGRVMKPGGFFDFTFDRTEGAEHHVLHEDFYYRTETLVALAGRHGLAGQLMKDWDELSHPQSRLRITRLNGLRYIAIAESDGGMVSWRRPTGGQARRGRQRTAGEARRLNLALRLPGLRTGSGTWWCSGCRTRSPRGGWTTPNSTSGPGRRSPPGRMRTWTSCSLTCPRRRRRRARHARSPVLAGTRSR